MHQLGSRLKQLRKSRGWTQKQLAEQIHKSAAAIGSYEQDVQIPPTDVLVSLAKLYHISLDNLLGFNCSSSYCMDALTHPQQEVLKMLIAEFTAPSGNGKELSLAQMQIINKLIQLFLEITIR